MNATPVPPAAEPSASSAPSTAESGRSSPMPSGATPCGAPAGAPAQPTASATTAASPTRVLPVDQLAAQPATDAPLVVLALCAQWCGTCREFRPTLERLAEARRDVVFAWADVEDDAELVGDLDVENFPTLALFRAGVTLHYGVSLPHESVVARLVETFAAAAPRAAPGLAAEIGALARRLSQPGGG